MKASPKIVPGPDLPLPPTDTRYDALDEVSGATAPAHNIAPAAPESVRPDKAPQRSAPGRTRDGRPGFRLDLDSGPLEVLFDVAMLRNLDALVRESGTADGPESGGLLLGRFVNQPGKTLLIEGYQGLIWDYARGGAPALGPVQAQFLQQKLSMWRLEPNSELQAVGYYRTARNGEAELTKSDMEILSCHFNRPTDLALIVKPMLKTVSIGALFYRRGGILEGEPLYCDFAFDEHTCYLPTHEPRGAISTYIHWIRSRWRTAVVALAMVVAALLLYRSPFALPQRFQPVAAQPEPVPASLDFRVARAGNDLHLSWNRNSPQIVAAWQGFLSISDGDTHKMIPLDRYQLLGAQFLYLPLTGDVTVRLEVLTDQQHRYAEAVRVYAGSRLTPEKENSSASGMPNAWNNPATAGTSSRSPEQSFLDSLKNMARAGSLFPPAVAPADAPETGDPGNHLPGFLSTPRDAQLLQPPQIDTGPAGLHIIPSAPVQQPPIALEPWVNSREPVPAENTGNTAPTPQVVREARIIPPKPLRIMAPALKSEIRNLVPRDLTMIVQVRVDASGKVSAAETVPPRQPGLLGYVARNALSVARTWRFEPATRDGVPIESVATIQVKF